MTRALRLNKIHPHKALLHVIVQNEDDVLADLADTPVGFVSLSVCSFVRMMACSRTSPTLWWSRVEWWRGHA